MHCSGAAVLAPAPPNQRTAAPISPPPKSCATHPPLPPQPPHPTARPPTHPQAPRAAGAGGSRTGSTEASWQNIPPCWTLTAWPACPAQGRAAARCGAALLGRGRLAAFRAQCGAPGGLSCGSWHAASHPPDCCSSFTLPCPNKFPPSRKKEQRNKTSTHHHRRQTPTHPTPPPPL